MKVQKNKSPVKKVFVFKARKLDMPRPHIMNKRRVAQAISKHSRPFLIPLRRRRLRRLDLVSSAYVTNRKFWSRKKAHARARILKVWKRLGRTINLTRLLPWYYLRYGKALRRWPRYKYRHKRRLVERYFKFALLVRKLKWLNSAASQYSNPASSMFMYYWSHLQSFFSRLNKKTNQRSKELLYWRAAWFSIAGLVVPETRMGKFILRLNVGQHLLRGVGTGKRFRLLGIWSERWWWSKARSFLTRPKVRLYVSSDNVVRAGVLGHVLLSGRALSEVSYGRVVINRLLADKYENTPEQQPSALLQYIKRSLGDSLVRMRTTKQHWQTLFSHRRHDIKARSVDLINALNFMHTSIWVSPFINAFVKRGAKQFIEVYIQRALIFLRAYLGWVFDFGGQIAHILDKGRPIFRFVVFIRKMKKRKRKTWTVPKVLFKDRGYIWGARNLWMRLSLTEGYKFIDRLITMMEEATDSTILDELITARYEQAHRASRLRRWMRFLRKKRRRAKLRSVLPSDRWWKYSWGRGRSFSYLRKKILFKKRANDTKRERYKNNR